MAAETGLKTPLYHIHTALGGKMVPFAGYLLPVQYPAGLIKEHMAVRTQCGLFDVSHMGEILLTGPDAVKNLNHLLTNDYTHMDDSQARYSPMCNEGGGVVDDLIVYKQEEDRYLLVVNAANKDKDYQWIASHLVGEAEAKTSPPGLPSWPSRVPPPRKSSAAWQTPQTCRKNTTPPILTEK